MADCTLRPVHPDPRVAAFFERYEAGAYFEAHEILEAFWMDYREADRDFYQGLIQAAVARHHAGRGNARGARGVAASCRNRLAPYLPTHDGFDTAAFLEALEREMP
jgi:predicted metal-dependent hydrolase